MNPTPPPQDELTRLVREHQMRLSESGVKVMVTDAQDSDLTELRKRLILQG